MNSVQKFSPVGLSMTEFINITDISSEVFTLAASYDVYLLELCMFVNQSTHSSCDIVIWFPLGTMSDQTS